MDSSSKGDDPKYGLRYFDKIHEENDDEGLVDDEGISSCPDNCCDSDCECDDCVRCANYAMGKDEEEFDSSAAAS